MGGEEWEGKIVFLRIGEERRNVPLAQSHTLTFSTASLLLAASILYREEVLWERGEEGGMPLPSFPCLQWCLVKSSHMI